MNSIVPRIDSRTARPVAGMPLADFASVSRQIVDTIETVIDGKREVATTALTVLLAEGHLLIEDVPGVGKTMLARALARSVDCTVEPHPIHPYLLPSDITGVSVFNQEKREFEFKPGPVFANLVIGDEINRASPKTQSALLESMEENHGQRRRGHLSAGQAVRRRRHPESRRNGRHLSAAETPARSVHGSDLDRLSRPGIRNGDAALAGADQPARERGPALVNTAQLLSMIHTVRSVYVSSAIEQYAVSIVQATRHDPDLRLGASPRATLHLVRAAKATAALAGRDFVLPDDIDVLAVAVLSHRLIPVRRAISGPGETRGGHRAAYRRVDNCAGRLRPKLVEPCHSGDEPDGR